MKLAIMQPYFFPYLGYFQLINSVDVFVVYDNVQYTKKGWFSRNQLFFNNKVEYFSISIVKDSDYLDVFERTISTNYFLKEMPKILRKIEQNYKNAPHYNQVYPLIKELFGFEEYNLFEYIYNALIKVLEYLEISTKIIKSSTLPLDHKLKNKYRVFNIYKHLNATHYINPSGGHDLYDKKEFLENGVNLSFLEQNLPKYKQLSKEFNKGLSIIDLMMFNDKSEITKMLDTYRLT